MKTRLLRLGAVFLSTSVFGWVGAQAQQPALQTEWVNQELRLTWPTNAAGYVLHEADCLAGDWRVAELQPQLADELFTVTIPCTDQARFFRLQLSGGDPWPIPALLGIVADPVGHPIADATVQGLAFCDENGVFSGDVTPTSAGWIRVDAPGFVSGFGQPLPLRNQTSVVQLWLNPLQTQAWLEQPTSTVTLRVGTAAQGLELTVPGEALEMQPAFVALAEQERLTLHPLFAPLEPQLGGVYLHRAFAVQAFDPLNTPVQLQEGRTLTLTVQDASGWSDPPELAWFNPESGHWVRLPGACQKSGTDRYTCNLPRIWPLYGLFVPGTPPYGVSSAGAPDSSRPPSRSTRRHDGEGPEGSYYGMLAQLQSRLKQLEEGTGDPATDPKIGELLEQLARWASDYAKAHPDESGKFVLLDAAARAGLLGRLNWEAMLSQQATEVANYIGMRLLNEAECGRIREIMHAIEQITLLGGNPAIEAALRAKLDILLAECDLWRGTVRYVFFVDAHLLIPHYQRQGGEVSWAELHEVTMATHAQTLVLTGELWSQVWFPKVRYLETGVDCGHFIDLYGLPAGTNFLELHFDGTYDGYTFALEKVSLSEHAPPMILWMDHISRIQLEDGSCFVDGITITELPMPYYSAIMHGFEGPWAEPPVTLQQMLDSGSQGETLLGYRTIDGWKRIANASGYPYYPFTAGIVTWTFIHFQAVLPLEL